MSHFEVLVIGDDVEAELAPFSEHLCVEPYQDTDYDHAAELEQAREFYRRYPDHAPHVDRDDDRAMLIEYNLDDEGLRFAEDGTSTRWSTYNPRSKWDYWQIGGRWSDSLLIRPGAAAEDYVPGTGRLHHRRTSDRARKRAVDFDAMVARGRAQAERAWAELTEATRGIAPPRRGWEEHRAAYAGSNDAGRIWAAHPWNRAARMAGFHNAYDEFCMGAADPRSAHTARAGTAAIGGYFAVVRGGEWIARGAELGSTAWAEHVRRLIDKTPDDAWLSTVDCHM